MKNIPLLFYYYSSIIFNYLILFVILQWTNIYCGAVQNIVILPLFSYIFVVVANKYAGMAYWFNSVPDKHIYILIFIAWDTSM